LSIKIKNKEITGGQRGRIAVAGVRALTLIGTVNYLTRKSELIRWVSTKQADHIAWAALLFPYSKQGNSLSGKIIDAAGQGLKEFVEYNQEVDPEKSSGACY